jgi:ABC-type lipoprotein export system ATPase subunit
MVGIARAIAGKPKLLLADEPTGNLHISQGKMIMEVLRELNNEGMTIIQVTHNDKFARYAKQIIKLEDGMIRENKITA